MAIISMPTHGSITKAGKVRGQTPKLKGRERHNLTPRLTLKGKYQKRIILKRKAGQNWPFSS
ncbi:MAG: 30S ribosomal protein S30e [Conexivisphaerales archaeon]